MSKPPSEATQIRSLKSQVKEVFEDKQAAEKARDIWRARATKAEEEAAEWKARFDLLLSKAGVIEPPKG